MAFEGMATPLGMKPGPAQRGVPPLWRWAMLGLFFMMLAFMLVIFGRRASAPSMPEAAVAIIERVAPGILPADRQPLPEKPQTGAIAAIEQGSGVNVVRPGASAAPQGVVIRVPDAPERFVGAGADPRVSERGQTGTLPRIGEGGLTPRAVYARAFTPPPGKPLIGIVMTGVGIGARGTTDAITKLPGEVTLAFAPYGRDLEQQAARARRDGHEIVLQVPMEPLDYPESDPGPHTLRVDSGANDNLERLHWLMSRFPGYVGLSNFMGSRLMADPQAYPRLLEEINRRGLVFLDDGTAPRSQTQELAAKLGLPVRVADRVFETGGAKSLEKVLAEIEDLARARQCRDHDSRPPGQY